MTWIAFGLGVLAGVCSTLALFAPRIWPADDCREDCPDLNHCKREIVALYRQQDRTMRAMRTGRLDD